MEPVPVRRINRWTQEEDTILIQRLYEQQSYDPAGAATDWQKIAAVLPGRSNKDCRKRWFNVLSGGLRKGAWSPEEDSFLRDAVRVEGKSWMRVAQHVPQRTADQCAKRWQHFLDPTLDRSEWTVEEQHGRHWLAIRNQYLPLRSPNSLKNQYSILMRRHEKSLASSFQKSQGSWELPASDYHAASTTSPKTPNRRSKTKFNRKNSSETDTYIKQEVEEDFIGSSIYGEVDYQSTMSPATDYGLISKGASTSDPTTDIYAGLIKQEEFSVTGYDGTCFGSSLGTQYEVNPAQLSHLDAGIPCHTPEELWLTYPTSPSSTAPSDGDLGSLSSHRDQWSYEVPGMALQEPSALAAYGYGGYQ
ncbi:conserved hypothetical protein [Microsporum canis CBS 113480]|uniref:Uncharacterized protein n=1 Tax=Arthroderma otae (strain ATCC MYA-4605 / CBS 113480) TaxID=554155 RepID=C5G0V9_ARTOC|nr:conserved hypothetical protein [Microsporum canis CBS 113480]EEQ35762.1 conserved hypothetical protein [Microsporum canis CBS 113480]